MSCITERCLDLFKQCTPLEKRLLLKLIEEDVQQLQKENAPSENENDSADGRDHFTFSKFISFHDELVDDKSFLEDVRLELDSMDLHRPHSNKIKSLWLNPAEVCGEDINSISKYPNVTKLLNIVNAQVSDGKGALNCCNIICYSNDKKSLRLHSDNESSISQTHPIATFSLGVTRRIEFVPIGSHHTRVVHSVDASNNSLYVMHPGCQSILKHRVLQGDSSGSQDHTRYSISFRKYGSILPRESYIQSPSEESPSSTPVSRIPASLLVGDSFLVRMDKERLEKNKKTVLNLAKGGNKIQNVIQSLHAFRNASENERYLITQIFISVGTNDIRYCKNGVSHLKGELFSLLRTIKNYFPTAKIYVQSFLPLPVTYNNENYVIKNVLNLNRLIYHVCVHERVFMIDVFKSFLYRRYRHPMLFPSNVNDIHPNRRGLGVLARKYIDILHYRNFDPLIPN